MAALVEGQQYGLSSTFASHDQKSVVHLKLTDSALKAIEDYLKAKDGSNKPTIQFQGNQGVIQIPHKSSKDLRTFQFSLSQFTDPNVSFDCVRQSDTRHGNHLSQMGTMHNKISIHATSDVFQATRERMTQVVEEKNSVCTQEIKPSGKHISRRIRKVRPDLDIKNTSSQAKPQPAAIRSKTAVVAPFSSNTTTTNSSLASLNSASSRHHSAVSSSTVPPSSHMTSSSSPHGNNTVSSSTTTSRSSTPTSSSSTVARSSTGSSKPPSSINSAVINLPFRDRVIHLLAVRPYKKVELILRLKNDGVREKDKEALSSTLQQVAFHNPRENKFFLNKYLYNEVRLDWPGYFENDKEIVKKKLESLSPAASPNTQHSPDSSSNSQKRPSDSSTLDHHQPASKKQRISHYEKLKKENMPLSGVNEGERRDIHSTVNGHDNNIKKENIDHDSSVEATSTSDTPAYINKYRMITNAEQRQKYKHDFNIEYEDYRSLHKNVEKVSQKFVEYEVQLRKTTPGSDEYENLKNKIRKEYKMQKSDPKYVAQKKRFEYLHKKLGHIKQLILEYDKQYQDS